LPDRLPRQLEAFSFAHMLIRFISHDHHTLVCTCAHSIICSHAHIAFSICCDLMGSSKEEVFRPF
jgi:hypothetical protein